MRHGGVTNRTGTKYICETKTPSKLIRLIKFVFNASQTYVLEFGDMYMRVIKNGVQLAVSSTPYEIATPYAEADLRSLNFEQSGDVISIVHPNYPPASLSRTGDTSWTLSVDTFAPGMTAPTGVTNAGAAGSVTQWVVTSVKAETYEESLSSTATTSSAIPSGQHPVSVSWSAVSGAIEYNVYKAINGVFGYIGVAQGTTFSDNGIVPDATDTPPQARNPFTGTGNYPSTVSYYQQRRLYASTINDPEKVWMSRIGNYKNFSIRSPLQDDDAVTFTIAGRQVNRIQSVIEIGGLLMLTSGGEWVVQGDADGVIKPAAINLQQQGYTGASALRPIGIGNNALYVQSRGSVIHDLRKDIQVQGYSGSDLTVFAAHLFDGYQVVAWDYAQIPHSVVWAVRNDGTLLGLTYVKDQAVSGWHRHDTQGTFEDVCVVPEGSEDAIYVCVNRTIGGVQKRYIERFATRYASQVVDITRDAFFVDCGGTYDGLNDGETTITVSNDTGLTVTGTQVLTASASQFIAGDVGNAYVLTVGGVSLRFRVLEYTDSTHVRVQAARNVPAEFVGVALTTWSRAVDEVTIPWLPSTLVSILADGNALEAQTTDGTGKVSLGRAYSVVHVGLKYTSEIRTLKLDSANNETYTDKPKLITEVSLQVESSRGIFAGPDADNLREYKQRRYEGYDDPVALQTGTIDVKTVAQWDLNGQIYVVQSDPLPLTILSIAARAVVSPR